jgi:flagellar hook protein FlgE
MNSQALVIDVASNNIANVNTVGFKKSEVYFQDVFAGTTLGGSGVNAVGGGVTTSTGMNFTTGTLNATGKMLDLGIKGNGFFIVNFAGATSYTRDGSFKIDADGMVVGINNGANLQGLKADGTFGSLSVSTQDMSPKATSLITYGLNLNSQDTTPTVAYTGAAGNITGIPDPKSYNFTTSTQVTDSKGVNHILASYFIKDTTNPNQYNVAYTFDGTDYPAPPVSPPSNSIVFSSDGSYSSTNPSPIQLSPTLTNGAQALIFDIDYTACTDFASPSVAQSVKNDGYTTGTISLVEVNQKGEMIAHYSNGQGQQIGTVQLASFSAPEGLTPVGSNMFEVTSASGQALISNAGGTAGVINSGYLEGSNADITADLVALGSASRNYKACSSVISTEANMLDTLINKIS